MRSFALVLVSLLLPLTLPACSKICVPDGCPSTVHLDRSVAITSEDIAHATLTACLNDVCVRGMCPSPDGGGLPQCSLPTPFASAFLGFDGDADGGTVFVVSADIAGPKDGDTYAFKLVRDDSGAVLLDVHATAAYRTFEPDGPGCGGPTCKAADL